MGVERVPEQHGPTEDLWVGAQCRREDDQLVTIQATAGARRVLSHGTTIELFRLVQRSAFPASTEAITS